MVGSPVGFIVGVFVGERDGATVGSLVGSVADVKIHIIAIRAMMEEHRKLVMVGRFLWVKKMAGGINKLKDE